MKNISLYLNLALLAAVAALFYLRSADKKTAEPAAIVAPANLQSGMKIAWVNADTLDSKFEWLKSQREALDKRLNSASSALESKMRSHAEKAAAFQQKADAGTTPPKDLQTEYEILAREEQRLTEEQGRLEKSLAEDRRNAMNEMYTKLEAKLRDLRSKIGYDYILSYSRGGQILLANDSLDITREVLTLLNAKEEMGKK
jgi:outer membrane protein